MARNKDQARKRRHYRIRKTMIGTGGKPRLTVFRSLRHVYAQLIDDTNGRTLVSASTLEKQVGGSGHGGNADAARRVGASIAKKALGKEIKSIVFDRSGYQYHGCIKALADAAREQGLSF